MIRIDEVYDNVFLPRALAQTNEGCKDNCNYRVGLHWFDPFGTTDFQNIRSQPPANWSMLPEQTGNPKDSTRVIFWDQEVLNRFRFHNFITPFLDMFESNIKRLVTSEYNSEDAQWACDTYGLTSDYYFFHGWAALDWYRGYNRTSLAQPFAERKPYNTFLCPNNIIGGERRHRIELLNQFANRNMLDRNLISFPDTCPYEGLSINAICKKYNLQVPNVRLPLTIDNGSGYAAQSHRIDLWEQANNSLIQVVTETAYDGNKQHLTEKSFKPIVMQQPFIIQSCKGSLEYLRRYGFKTFSEFWDESYDEHEDDRRTQEIGKVLYDINNMSQKEKASLQKAVSNTVQHNFDWFYSDKFENILWDELNEMTNQW